MVDIINAIIDFISTGLSWVIDLLPNSPFLNLKSDVPEGVNLGYITYFIPFPTMLVHFAGLLVAIGFYYLYRVIARWLKLVRG